MTGGLATYCALSAAWVSKEILSVKWTRAERLRNVQSRHTVENNLRENRTAQPTPTCHRVQQHAQPGDDPRQLAGGGVGRDEFGKVEKPLEGFSLCITEAKIAYPRTRPQKLI